MNLVPRSTSISSSASCPSQPRWVWPVGMVNIIRDSCLQNILAVASQIS